MERLLYRICTFTLSLSKPKIIVRREVEASSRGSSEGKSDVTVLRFTIEEFDGSSGNPGDRGKKAVVRTLLDPPSVKGIKVRVERCVALSGRRKLVATLATYRAESSRTSTGINDLHQREAGDGMKRDEDASQRNLEYDPYR
jgi:hypothetical protein